ncbi:hypothetical protein M0Q50_03230 [bacterium]|jgi:hypothetical protein|nr:hypothetical protein [bacterium]
MDEQNTNHQNGDLIRTDESVVTGQVEKIKRLFRALAVLVVFISSFSVPVYVSYKTQTMAKEMRVRMDMGQLKNWAIIYKLEHNDYDGFKNDPEITRVFNDIKLMGGEAYIFVSNDAKKYCCQTNFIDKSFGSWCVDYTGNVGSNGKCGKNNIQCK